MYFQQHQLADQNTQHIIKSAKKSPRDFSLLQVVACFYTTNNYPDLHYLRWV